MTSIRAALLLLLAVPDGAPCTGQGARLVPAHWEDGPRLGCAGAPASRYWRIYSPAHHETVPMAGSTLVSVRQLPQWIVRYACTGSWLWPVTITQVRTYGYVFDVTVRRC